jgi:hypothetical protein
MIELGPDALHEIAIIKDAFVNIWKHLNDQANPSLVPLALDMGFVNKDDAAMVQRGVCQGR